MRLDDYEALARERLDANAWAYFAGGAADEITLRANREAWAAHWLHPRVLRTLAHGHTRVELLGRTLAHPILVAPMAFQRLAHDGGELASGFAAAVQGAGMVLSAQASVPLEDVARLVLPEATRGPLWFQLYLQGDRGFDLDLVRRAEAAGFEALVLTVDAPMHGARDRERRAGFALPGGIAAVNLAGAPPLPRGGELCGGLLAAAPGWDDVDWLRAQTRLPLVLKGVLHPDDAKRAQARGADALIVSNHGGRTLDTALPTAWALPRIADALGGTLPLLVDGGIRRGTDVLKALALGARAVLVGRPIVFALAAAGPQGVAHALRLLRDELEIAMALAGIATLDAVPRELLFDAPKSQPALPGSAPGDA
ncbi:alpha-hydroxy acid oxidase [Piscinibacter sp.]|uniref:alpha-hydroxy acid oxidase n=1 Tax=Piscinibacter sp. TaxID=1903157 RepID=UPI0039E255A9